MGPPPSSPRPQSDAERRRSPRYNLALDVEFGLAGSAGGRPTGNLQQTVTVNLSLHGLCLYSDTLYPISTQLFCALSLPGSERPVDVVGTVVWFQKVNQDTHAYKLGIDFCRLAAEDLAILQALFDRPPEPAFTKAKRLLLVDDDEELRLALKLRFESVGYEVLTADNGLEALRKGREERAHCIILDLMLPSLNGFEVCRLLKFDQQYQHIPIILLTARCRREDAEIGRAVGADAYVTKPFSGQDLIAKVEELLVRPKTIDHRP